jgi:hypothetical protein
MVRTLQLLQGGAETGVAVLLAALEDSNVWARCQAAGALLGFSLKAMELTDVQRRLDALERALAERTASAPGGDWQ